jgi:hypothetical protein
MATRKSSGPGSNTTNNQRARRRETQLVDGIRAPSRVPAEFRYFGTNLFWEESAALRPLPNDLETFEMKFEGKTAHNGAASGNKKKHIQTRFFPRDIQSLIANSEIKINGQPPSYSKYNST